MRLRIQQIVFLLFSVLLGIGCENGFKMNQEASSDFASQGTMTITTSGVDESQTIAQAFDLDIEVTPMDRLKILRVVVNNQELIRFFKMPFTVNINPYDYTEGQLYIKVEATDKNDQVSEKLLVLNKPGPGEGQDGTLDANCLVNGLYDACLFYKNPVATRGAAYPRMVRMGDDLSDSQIYGVKIKGLSTPDRLQNSSIRVTTGEGDIASPDGGRWIKAYQDDGSSQHYIAQLMAYYWLNHLEEQMMSRAGSFYARNKNITVNAFQRSVKNNAYWDSRQIVMGVARDGSTDAHEMALSAEVYVHEMGHANLQHATGRQLIADPSTTTCGSGTCFCLTDQGCVGAMNEGQADFHMLMIFPDKPALGETWQNNVSGLPSRNVIANKDVSVSQAFSSSDGQIHRMGAIYASILWNIYNNPQVQKLEFEKIFMKHLRLLSETSTFASGRDALLQIDSQDFGGKYSSIISGEFTRRGVQ